LHLGSPEELFIVLLYIQYTAFTFFRKLAQEGIFIWA